MGARKRKEWGTLVGVRVPTNFIERIDRLVEKGGYRSRAEVFLTALRLSIASLETNVGIPPPKTD